MIGNEWLEKAIKMRISKHEQISVVHRICNDTFSLDQLLQGTFSPKKEEAFRAAWLFEQTVLHCPRRLSGSFENFLSAYPVQQNQSCRRHFTKIMLFLLSAARKNVYFEIMAQLSLEEQTVSTFDWLIDPATPVAVKVNCLDILFLLRNRHDWIREELKEVIVLLLKDASPAMRSRGGKILKKL